MKAKIKYILLAGTATFLLGACAGGNDEAAKESVEANQEKMTEEAAADESYFVDDIQTSFAVEPTILPRLSAEEKVLGMDIASRLTELETRESEEVPKFLTQRERIELIIDEFPGYTVNELLYLHEDYHTLKWSKGTSDRYYMDKSDYMTVERHVFEANVNLPYNAIRFLGGTGDSGSDHSYYDFRGKLEIEGQEVPYEIRLEFDADYTEATLTKLSIDGESAFE